MVTIYNVASGEAKILDMVDAREHVTSGRWAFAPPVPVVEPDPVPVVEPDPVPVVEPDPVPVVEPDPVEAKLAELDAAMHPKAKAKK